MGIKSFLQNILKKLGLYAPEGIMYIGGPETLPPPMSKEEEARYIRMLATDGEIARKKADRAQFKAGGIHSTEV